MEKRQYKHETFNDTDLEKEEEFSKYDAITFIGCKFTGEVLFKSSSTLRFSNCTFENEWTHVICEKIVYSKCTFENFVYNNISKEKDVSKDSVLFDCTFKSIDCEGIIFEKPFLQIVDEKKDKHLDDVKLVRCEFKDDFILKVSDNSEKDRLIEIKFSSIDLTDSTFHKKFKMQYCSIENKSVFYNTKFKDLADFYQTKFNEVIFERTDFESISVFSESEFNKDVDFKYTKFLGKAIFRDTVLKGKLNLRDTIFDDEATFLDITSEKRKRDENKEFYCEPKVIQVANRETARIIKNFYDNSNNIIEANKFYALEMKEREKELKDGEIWEYMVFKFHGMSSNHSQDWILSILWIVFISLIYTMAISNIYHNEVLSLISKYTIFIPFIFSQNIVIKIYLIINIIFLYFIGIINLDKIADKINPFSIMTSTDPIPFGLLLFKITIAYLIYQFIVSVRQNTRRK